MGLNYGLQCNESHWAAAGLLVGGPQPWPASHVLMLSGGRAHGILYGASVRVSEVRFWGDQCRCHC